MAHKESAARTLTVALVLSLVSSVFVAGTAVTLRPLQLENRLLDRQRSIAEIAGMGGRERSADEVRALFGSTIQARLVDLDSGRFSDAFDAATFDAARAARDPQLSVELAAAEDIASIRRRERYATVYLVEGTGGALEAVILPVRGAGLWSTMHGFLALRGDLNTVIGLGFHEHAETPGLGGEIDNPRWLARWPGRRVFDGNGELAVQVVKGAADPQGARAAYQVDGLAGATLTSNGVNNLLHFWLGERGFGPFLARLRSGEA